VEACVSGGREQKTIKNLFTEAHIFFLSKMEFLFVLEEFVYVIKQSCCGNVHRFDEQFFNLIVDNSFFVE
jgi:hypothetical protein